MSENEAATYGRTSNYAAFPAAFSSSQAVLALVRIPEESSNFSYAERFDKPVFHPKHKGLALARPFFVDL
jgi:hypothetical protein